MLPQRRSQRRNKRAPGATFPAIRYPGQHPRRATVVGAGRWHGRCRSDRPGRHQDHALVPDPGRPRSWAASPRQGTTCRAWSCPAAILRAKFGAGQEDLRRSDLILLAVPSKGVGDAIDGDQSPGCAGRRRHRLAGQGACAARRSNPHRSPGLRLRPGARRLRRRAPRTHEMSGVRGGPSCVPRAPRRSPIGVAEAFQRAGVV